LHGQIVDTRNIIFQDYNLLTDYQKVFELFKAKLSLQKIAILLETVEIEISDLNTELLAQTRELFEALWLEHTDLFDEHEVKNQIILALQNSNAQTQQQLINNAEELVANAGNAGNAGNEESHQIVANAVDQILNYSFLQHYEELTGVHIEMP
jgi:hypothetical protein